MKRHRCAACLAEILADDLGDAVVTDDELGPVLFCDDACAEAFERALDGPEVAERLARASRAASRRELAEDFDPIAEDLDD